MAGALEDGSIGLAPAGGLHHAHPDRASGFCIFNDVAVAIATARGQGRKVAYVDLDAHHGDGVMYGFYRDGGLLDIDFHQDGRTLFPGTGDVTETGAGDGRGLKVNVPLPPGAGDEALVPLAARLLPPLLRDFRPGVVVVQHGVDGHWGDPLAHLRYTAAGYAEVDRRLRGLAQEIGARLVVTGGGGYRAASVSRVLARTGRLLADLPLPADDAPLPPLWVERFSAQFEAPAPRRWIDRPPSTPSPWSPEREERLVAALASALGRPFPVAERSRRSTGRHAQG
jgi:acetoin utilization protein AcuC